MKILNRSGELAFAAHIRPAKDVATTHPAKVRQHQFAATLMGFMHTRVGNSTSFIKT